MPPARAWRPTSACGLDGPTPRPGGLPAQDRAASPARPGACTQLTLSPASRFRRYYKVTSGLMLDVGGYTKALEVPALGPPSPQGCLGRFWSRGGAGVLTVRVAFHVFRVGPRIWG